MIQFAEDKTTLMGVLNVTPDSFSDGGRFYDVDAAVAHAKQMISEGADIIDIGGESSRPGSDPVSEEEELRRVLPVIDALAGELTVPLSIDTYKPVVAEEALKRGVQVMNDISGLSDPAMVAVAAKYNAPVILMHMQGAPKTMQAHPHYEDVIVDIKAFFAERIATARAAGIEQLILDPGIGFGKSLGHNLEILRHLGDFTDLGFPIMIGTSRKSFLGKLGLEDMNDRLEGTIASNVIAAMHGARIIRVHDVAAHKRAFLVADPLIYT